MTSCPRLGKLIGGCRFRPRYDLGAPLPGNFNGIDADGGVRLIEALMNDPVSEWYALSTEPRRERVAAAGLAERNISFFMPMSRDWAMERGRVTNEYAYSPLFQGYIFALLQVRQMADVMAVEGICRFVKLMDNTGEQRPFPIPALEIIRLQAEDRAGGFDRTVNITPAPYRPKKGDQVLVIAGPYLTSRGTITAAPKTSRVEVTLEDGRSPMLLVSHLELMA